MDLNLFKKRVKELYACWRTHKEDLWGNSDIFVIHTPPSNPPAISSFFYFWLTGQDLLDTTAIFTQKDIYFITSKFRVSLLQTLAGPAMEAMNLQVSVIEKAKGYDGSALRDCIIRWMGPLVVGYVIGEYPNMGCLKPMEEYKSFEHINRGLLRMSKLFNYGGKKVMDFENFQGLNDLRSSYGENNSSVGSSFDFNGGESQRMQCVPDRFGPVAPTITENGIAYECRSHEGSNSRVDSIFHCSDRERQMKCGLDKFGPVAPSIKEKGNAYEFRAHEKSNSRVDSTFHGSDKGNAYEFRSHEGSNSRVDSIFHCSDHRERQMKCGLDKFGPVAPSIKEKGNAYEFRAHEKSNSRVGSIFHGSDHKGNGFEFRAHEKSNSRADSIFHGSDKGNAFEFRAHEKSNSRVDSIFHGSDHKGNAFEFTAHEKSNSRVDSIFHGSDRESEMKCVLDRFGAVVALTEKMKEKGNADRLRPHEGRDVQVQCVSEKMKEKGNADTLRPHEGRVDSRMKCDGKEVQVQCVSENIGPVMPVMREIEENGDAAKLSPKKDEEEKLWVRKEKGNASMVICPGTEVPSDVEESNDEFVLLDDDDDEEDEWELVD